MKEQKEWRQLYIIKFCYFVGTFPFSDQLKRKGMKKGSMKEYEARKKEINIEIKDKKLYLSSVLQ